LRSRGTRHGREPRIGCAIAQRLARYAALRGTPAIVVLARAQADPSLATAALDLEREGVRVLFFAGKLSDPDVPSRFVEQALTFCGGLDALVSDAAIPGPGPLVSMSRDSWDLLFSFNARAPWLPAQAGYPALRDTRGAYIAIALMSVFHPILDTAPNPARKAAITMLCQQVVHEWTRA
jgi:NAD(P)-dependent dehydrogenase (short-subunit alcohol dehydrogenase family)